MLFNLSPNISFTYKINLFFKNYHLFNLSNYELVFDQKNINFNYIHCFFIINLEFQFEFHF
jgi:hypothetical protein